MHAETTLPLYSFRLTHPKVIIDTNVFVAAGFSRRSPSAEILHQIRAGALCMIWHEQTCAETEYILRKIPPLSWEIVQDLFRPEDRYPEDLDSASFSQIPDTEDRKFVALSAATGAVLITQDRGILSNRDRVPAIILRPSEFLEPDPIQRHPLLDKG